MPIASSVELGSGVRIPHPELVNLYGCVIGDESSVGPFVEIQRGVRVGRLCKVQSHTFICEGVTLEDEVFVGHGVMFINDRRPRAALKGRRVNDGEWPLTPTLVKKGAAIGSGAVIMGGVTIGTGATIGAGAVVTKDVAAGATVAGVPARLLRSRSE